MNIGYERTLHANETVQEAEQAVHRALLETKKVMEDKPQAHQRRLEERRKGLVTARERLHAEEEGLLADAVRTTARANQPRPIAGDEAQMLRWRVRVLAAEERLVQLKARLQEIPRDEEALDKEDKAQAQPSPWHGKEVRFMGGPRLETTITPDGEERLPDGTTKPRFKTVVTGTWEYEVV